MSFDVRCVTQIRYTWLIDCLRGEWSDFQFVSMNQPPNICGKLVNVIEANIKLRGFFVRSVQVIVLICERSYRAGSIISRC